MVTSPDYRYKKKATWSVRKNQEICTYSYHCEKELYEKPTPKNLFGIELTDFSTI